MITIITKTKIITMITTTIITLIRTTYFIIKRDRLHYPNYLFPYGSIQCSRVANSEPPAVRHNDYVIIFLQRLWRHIVTIQL